MDNILFLIIILTIIVVIMYISNKKSRKQKKPTKITPKISTSIVTAPKITTSAITNIPFINSFNRSLKGISKSNPNAVLNHPLVAKHKLKKGSTSYYKLNHTTFYANWSQFWPGGPDDKGTNSPNTFKSFIGDADKIIYGFLLFGVAPNPLLKCQGVCKYSDEAMSIDYLSTSFLNNFKDSINTTELTAIVDYFQSASPDLKKKSYIPTKGFSTFPPYPSECFTGSNPSGSYGGTPCPMNGRLHDFICFEQLKSLKTINPGLKIVASYGGWTWTHGGASFSDISEDLYTQMVSTPENRSVFIDSSFKFLTKYGFNGVDFDWEYQGQKSAYDFYGFECLIKEYKQHAPDFVISMQCSGFLSSNVVTMNMDSLPGYKEAGIQLTMKSDLDYFIWMNRLLAVGLDNINIMAYDYYTAASQPKLTRPNAPLYNKDYPNIHSVSTPVVSTSVSTAVSTTSVPVVTTSTTTNPSDEPFNKCSLTSYTVKSGDSISDIALANNTTVNNLCVANNLSETVCPNLIVGQVLNIPNEYWVPECKPTSSCKSNTYVFKSGDTMYGLSVANKIDLTSFCALNNLTVNNCSSVYVGQTIKLPDTCTTTYPIISLGPVATPIDDIDYCLSKTLALMESVLTATGMKKVILGLGCYGRAFSGVNFGNLKGQDLIDKTVGIPFSGPAPAGNYSGEAGILSYYEINQRDWTMKGYNKQFGASIAVDVEKGIWVSYDDEDALLEKMEVARKYNVGGVMTFTPQQDDFSNQYPLMQTVSNHL